MESNTGLPWIMPERTASYDTCRTRIRTSRRRHIRTGNGVIIRIPVKTPFPHVAVHIVESVGIRKKQPRNLHLHGLGASINIYAGRISCSAILCEIRCTAPSVTVKLRRTVSEVIVCRGARAAGKLPFRLGRQVNSFEAGLSPELSDHAVRRHGMAIARPIVT